MSQQVLYTKLAPVDNVQLDQSAANPGRLQAILGAARVLVNRLDRGAQNYLGALAEARNSGGRPQD